MASDDWDFVATHANSKPTLLGSRLIDCLADLVLSGLAIYGLGENGLQVGGL